MKAKITLFFLLILSGIVNAQVEAGVPDDLFLCDVNNPGDEFEVFDLTTNEAQIINGQSNVVVTYHLTSGAALSGILALANPESYQNISNPEPIWARLQSTAGQGWSVTSFQIFVAKIPVIETQPDDIFIDEGDGNAEAEFDLTVNEAQMLGSADPFDFQFHYFTTAIDAQNNENPIVDPEAYVNQTNPQTIYGRYDYFMTGCEAELFDFEIQTDGALGITDNRLDRLVMAPNPTSNSVSLSGLDQTKDYSVELFDLSGRIINRFSSQNRSSIQLDLSNYVPAIYILRVVEGTKTWTRQIVRRP